jgi:hypothetical protein
MRNDYMNKINFIILSVFEKVNGETSKVAKILNWEEDLIFSTQKIKHCPPFFFG